MKVQDTRSKECRVTLKRLNRIEDMREHRKNQRAEMFSNNRIIHKPTEDTKEKQTNAKEVSENFRHKEKTKEISSKYKYKERTKPNSIVLERIIEAEKLQEHRKNKRSNTFLNNRNISGMNNVLNNKDTQKATKVSSVTSKRLDELLKKNQSKRVKIPLDKRPPFVVGTVHYPLCPIPPLNIMPPKSSRQTVKPQSNPPKKISKATEKRLAAKAASAKSQTENKPVTNLTTNTFKPKIPFTRKIIKKKEVKEPTKNGTMQTKKVEADLNSTFEKVTEDLVEDKKNKVEEVIGKVQNSTEKKEIKTNEKEKNNQNILLSRNRTSTPNSSVESICLQLSSNTDNSSRNVNESMDPAFFSPYIVSSRGKKNARKERESRLGLSGSLDKELEVPTKETVMQQLNVSVEDEKTVQYYLFLGNREKERLKILCKDWEGEKDGAPNKAKQKIDAVLEDAQVLLNKRMDWFLGLVNDCKNGRLELVSCKDLRNFWDIVCSDITECNKGFKYLDDLKSNNWRSTPDPKMQVLENDDKNLLLLDKIPKPRHCSTPLPSFKSKVKVADFSLSEGLNLLTLKAPNVEFDSSISYVNSEQTPACGILKKSSEGESSMEEKARKSLQKVNFNETISTVEISEDEDTKLRRTLAEALSKIDSYGSGDEMHLEMDINRKLIFNDSDDDNNEIQTPKSIFAEMQEVAKKESNQKTSSVRDGQISNNLNLLTSDDDDEDDDTVFIKSLRSRTINTSVKDSTKKRNKNRSKSDGFVNNEKLDSTHLHIKESESNRRSKRKSVRFDEEKCTACTPQKRRLKAGTPRRIRN